MGWIVSDLLPTAFAAADRTGWSWFVSYTVPVVLDVFAVVSGSKMSFLQIIDICFRNDIATLMGFVPLGPDKGATLCIQSTLVVNMFTYCKFAKMVKIHLIKCVRADARLRMEMSWALTAHDAIAIATNIHIYRALLLDLIREGVPQTVDLYLASIYWKLNHVLVSVVQVCDTNYAHHPYHYGPVLQIQR